MAGGVELRTPTNIALVRAAEAGYLADAVPAQTPEEDLMVADQERAFQTSRFHDELVSRIIAPEALKTTINALRTKLPKGKSIPFKILPTNSRHTEIEVTVRHGESIVTTETTLGGLTKIRTAVCYSAVEGRSDTVDWQREPRIWFVPAPVAGNPQPVFTGFAAIDASRKAIAKYEVEHPAPSSPGPRPSDR